jgi:hypothetical protein
MTAFDVEQENLRSKLDRLARQRTFMTNVQFRFRENQDGIKQLQRDAAQWKFNHLQFKLNLDCLVLHVAYYDYENLSTQRQFAQLAHDLTGSMYKVCEQIDAHEDLLDRHDLTLQSDLLDPQVLAAATNIASPADIRAILDSDTRLREAHVQHTHLSMAWSTSYAIWMNDCRIRNLELDKALNRANQKAQQRVERIFPGMVFPPTIGETKWKMHQYYQKREAERREQAFQMWADMFYEIATGHDRHGNRIPLNERIHFRFNETRASCLDSERELDDIIFQIEFQQLERERREIEHLLSSTMKSSTFSSGTENLTYSMSVQRQHQAPVISVASGVKGARPPTANADDDTDEDEDANKDKDKSADVKSSRSAKSTEKQVQLVIRQQEEHQKNVANALQVVNEQERTRYSNSVARIEQGRAALLNQLAEERKFLDQERKEIIQSRTKMRQTEAKKREYMMVFKTLMQSGLPQTIWTGATLLVGERVFAEKYGEWTAPVMTWAFRIAGVIMSPGTIDSMAKSVGQNYLVSTAANFLGRKFFQRLSLTTAATWSEGQLREMLQINQLLWVFGLTATIGVIRSRLRRSYARPMAAREVRHEDDIKHAQRRDEARLKKAQTQFAEEQLKMLEEFRAYAKQLAGKGEEFREQAHAMQQAADQKEADIENAQQGCLNRMFSRFFRSRMKTNKRPVVADLPETEDLIAQFQSDQRQMEKSFLRWEYTFRIMKYAVYSAYVAHFLYHMMKLQVPVPVPDPVKASSNNPTPDPGDAKAATSTSFSWLWPPSWFSSTSSKAESTASSSNSPLESLQKPPPLSGSSTSPNKIVESSSSSSTSENTSVFSGVQHRQTMIRPSVTAPSIPPPTISKPSDWWWVNNNAHILRYKFRNFMPTDETPLTDSSSASENPGVAMHEESPLLPPLSSNATNQTSLSANQSALRLPFESPEEELACKQLAVRWPAEYNFALRQLKIEEQQSPSLASTTSKLRGDLFDPTLINSSGETTATANATTTPIPSSPAATTPAPVPTPTSASPSTAKDEVIAGDRELVPTKTSFKHPVSDTTVQEQDSEPAGVTIAERDTGQGQRTSFDVLHKLQRAKFTILQGYEAEALQGLDFMDVAPLFSTIWKDEKLFTDLAINASIGCILSIAVSLAESKFIGWSDGNTLIDILVVSVLLFQKETDEVVLSRSIPAKPPKSEREILDFLVGQFALIFTYASLRALRSAIPGLIVEDEDSALLDLRHEKDVIARKTEADFKSALRRTKAKINELNNQLNEANTQQHLMIMKEYDQSERRKEEFTKRIATSDASQLLIELASSSKSTRQRFEDEIERKAQIPRLTMSSKSARTIDISDPGDSKRPSSFSSTPKNLPTPEKSKPTERRDMIDAIAASPDAMKFSQEVLGVSFTAESSGQPLQPVVTNRTTAVYQNLKNLFTWSNNSKKIDVQAGQKAAGDALPGYILAHQKLTRQNNVNFTSKCQELAQSSNFSSTENPELRSRVSELNHAFHGTSVPLSSDHIMASQDLFLILTIGTNKRSFPLPNLPGLYKYVSEWTIRAGDAAVRIPTQLTRSRISLEQILQTKNRS